ncbi:hypothetical protein EV363DRAFT_1166576 [Boletus edulis]|nr:hypothetical protein EV363DRAFT_1166576 [Boletus edulis]
MVFLTGTDEHGLKMQQALPVLAKASTHLHGTTPSLSNFVLKARTLDTSNRSLLLTSSWDCTVHGELIVYSTSRAIMFWHISTHIQLALIHHPSLSLFFITISPDDQFLTVGGRDGKITIYQ